MTFHKQTVKNRSQKYIFNIGREKKTAHNKANSIKIKEEAATAAV